MEDDEQPLVGERVNGKRHIPEYTEGCWGKPGRKLCWICKYRYVRNLFRLFR